MALSPGVRLGPYEIGVVLGAGGNVTLFRDETVVPVQISVGGGA
jgi:hypothetical protein